MYYEVHGDGPPAVLMQRSGHHRRRRRAPPAPPRCLTASDRRRVAGTRPHRRRRPAAPLRSDGRRRRTHRHLGLATADFVGYSMGGGVAVPVALDHANLARRVVFAGGASYRPDGVHHETDDGSGRGRPRSRPRRVIADKADSHPSTRQALRAGGIAFTSPERRDQGRPPQGQRPSRGPAANLRPGHLHAAQRRRAVLQPPQTVNCGGAVDLDALSAGAARHGRPDRAAGLWRRFHTPARRMPERLL
jgi:pimeloyl-ACP methyl ester carboxylesterase